MKRILSTIALALAPAFALADQHCDICDEWNAAQAPFSMYGNTYYVGVRGISVVLITTPSGHVLIDGALEQSVPRVVANMRELGFRIEDVKYILNSHAHFDHAGGIAELQRLSGATVLAGPAGAKALSAGKVGSDDPQFGDSTGYAPVRNARAVADGEKIKLGGLEITAHYTPGHTPGGATWTWQSCEGKTCANMVFADSLTPVSADDYRFTAHPAVVADLERSIANVEALPCDVLVSAHPEYTRLFERQARQREIGNAAFVDPAACRALATKARAGLAARLATERGQR
ncbi:MAG: subclass B3 metallo-beta-lactamase [Pseudomonadota bacterium]